ncbi:MAG: group II intron reverse transcriptase/maturase, partial [Alphaproteobacteria bacterium]|nr:group II intron reverse transcriptase/maturase [Alphaproteobacteria bacterium]
AQGSLEGLDLEKFFDRVNHDILMARLARRIGDKRLLRIIRRFLEAGMLQDGVCVRRTEGTPQGGPLSPLLANILLDDLDKELEKRGHRFCRYADDCNIYVRSQAAGERVMASVTRFLEHRLRLRVNRQKSAVAPVEERGFLGYRLTREGRPTVAPKSVSRAKDRLRAITDRKRAIPLERFVAEVNGFLAGWVMYFRHADDERAMQALGGRARRRLRSVRLFQCRHPKGIRSLLTSLGVPTKRAVSVAWTNKGWWRKARLAPTQEGMNNAWFAGLGLVDPLQKWCALQDDGNRRGTRSVRPVV